MFADTVSIIVDDKRSDSITMLPEVRNWEIVLPPSCLHILPFKVKKNGTSFQIKNRRLKTKNE